MIIGISGLAGSGKDTCADFFVRDHKFTKVAFSDPMKRICMDVYGFSFDQLWGDSRFRNMPDKRHPRRPDYWEYPHAPIGSIWVPLHNERGHTLVEDDDFESVALHRWVLNKKEEGKNTDYVRATIDGKKVSLHSFLMRPADGLVVDHVNGNGLDNRRKNLRVCTKAENRQNSNKRKDGESVFKGVGRIADRDGWRAYINEDGRLRTIGYYQLEEEAALAYDVAATERFGKYARLNSDRFLTPRLALQLLGSEWGRVCYPDTWVEYAIDVAMKLSEEGGYEYSDMKGLSLDERHPFIRNKTTNVVIPDVRFENELVGLDVVGARTIRVVRPNAGLGGAAGAHRSEQEQGGIPDSRFDLVIQNAWTLKELQNAVETAVRMWSAEK